MLGYLSADIICSEKRTVFREANSFPRASLSESFALGKLFASRKTVRFSEQIMSKDKCPSIFSRQMKAIVYIFPHGIIGSNIPQAFANELISGVSSI